MVDRLTNHSLTRSQTMMKQFHSRFEQIRRLREQCERLAKADVAARSAEVADAHGHERSQQSLLSLTQRSAGTEFQMGVSGSILATLRNAVVQAEQALAEATDARILAETRLQQAMLAFHSTRMERETVEQVINRDRRQHRLLEIRHHDQQLLERAAQDWYRKQLSTAADAETHS